MKRKAAGRSHRSPLPLQEATHDRDASQTSHGRARAAPAAARAAPRRGRTYLEAALSYRNGDVLNKFHDQYDVTEPGGGHLHPGQEVPVAGGQIRVAISPLLINDEMAHLVLFTRQYQEYCPRDVRRLSPPRAHDIRRSTAGAASSSGIRFRQSDARRLRRESRRSIGCSASRPAQVVRRLPPALRDDFFHSDRPRARNTAACRASGSRAARPSWLTPSGDAHQHDAERG